MFQAAEATAVAVAAGDVAAAVIKAEIPAIDAEVTVCDDSERANDKAPETPVTEPLTNGSSAPETPKEEEVRQKGDAVEALPIVAEKVPEVEAKLPETPKAEEKPEIPAVDSLPINGLKIEDSVPEVVNIPAEVEVPTPEVVAEKIEEVVIVSEKAPEPVEETPAPAVVPEPEVCVVAGSAEVLAPPLPSCPPPSSLTVFAESTMAPLVDTPVATLPVVDVEASLPPAPEEAAVCEITPVNNLPTALPNEIAPLPLVSDVPASDANIPSLDDVIAPAPVSDDTKTSESPSIENVAVVSPSEIITPDPSSIIETPASNPSVEIPSSPSDVVVEEVIKPAQVVSAVQSSPVVSQLLEPVSDVPLNSEIPQTVESVEKIPQQEDLPLPAPISAEDEIEKVVTEPVSTSVDSVLPTIENAMDSPVLQRALSDLDVSAAEPQSDSFPPPPPPESCPESMTELSVSESLPPPLSENSLPDTVVNSPSSETVELPSKEPQEVEPKEPEQVKEAEVVPALVEPSGDAEQAKPPTESAQVNST